MRVSRGIGLVDIIVGVGLMTVLFVALFGILRASLLLSALGKAQAAATELAETQMEQLRGLSYDALGTAGGIPSGSIPATSVQTIDGLSYTVRTFIQYYDDPADGTGASDDNGITTDYKTATVTITYTSAGNPRSVTLVSSFAPPSIETTTGGGTLSIHVVDSTGADVSGAQVDIANTALSPAVQLTAFTNTHGYVSLPGATPSSEYQITVSKNGFSTARTYARDSQNVNPTPGYLTVAKDQTTTGTFAIDTLGSLALTTLAPAKTTSFSDTFTDDSGLSTKTNVDASLGSLTLTGGATSGEAIANEFAPTSLDHWVSATAAVTTPPGTAALLHIYDSAGALVPDSSLAGNAAGFDTFPVDLSGLSTTTYPSLSIGATLTGSGDTPSIADWTLTAYQAAQPLPNVAFTLTGTKTIGSNSSDAPIYKTIVSGNSGATGSVTEPLEWDSYTLAIPNYAIADLCPWLPYALPAGGNLSARVTLVSHSTNSLLVTVATGSGATVPGASVTLAKTGYSKTVTSSSCGTAYFSGLSSGTYTITIAQTGYTTTDFPGVSVSGETIYATSFP